MVGGARPPAGRGARGARAARAAPGRAGGRRDRPSTTPARPAARRGRRDRIARGMGTAVATQWVYDFAEGSRDMRDLLGGKGANVAEMTRVLGAERVPAGFTITTEACVAYMTPTGASPDGLERAGRRGAGAPGGAGRQAAGRPRRPAARLGALRRARVDAGDARHRPEPRAQRRVGRRASPARTGNERFAWDSYRRFVQMFGNVVRGRRGRALRGRDQAVKERARRQRRHRARRRRAARADARRSKGFYDFPPDPREQLRGAIRAVFDSWMGERAVAYRRINRIPDDWGTAVNVQQMVFGNKGDDVGLGRRLQPRRGHRRARAQSATSCPTPRARTSSAACATPRDIARAARVACPRSTRS